MKKEFRFLSLAAASLMVGALASCSDDKIGDGGESPVEPVDKLSTASYTVGGGDQNRVANTGYWYSPSRATSAYNYNFPAEIGKAEGIKTPEGAVKYTSEADYQNDGDIYAIPAGNYVKESQWEVGVNFPNEKNLTVYVESGATLKNLGSNINHLDLYICEGAEVTIDLYSMRECNIYNEGNLKLPNGFDGTKIKNIYNTGNVEIGTVNDWGKTLPDGVAIYSKGGYVEFNASDEKNDWSYSETLINGNIICDNIVKSNGKIKFQYTTGRDICHLISTDLVEIVDGTNIFGQITAPDMKFDGCVLNLHPEGKIEASNEINIPNNGCSILAYADGEKGLVECKTLSIHLVNMPLASAIGQGVYLNAEALYDQASSTNYTDLSEFEVASQNHINADVKVAPSCSGDAETTPEPEPNKPSLDLVSNVESPSHDHDADKNDPNRRHLSATSLTFDGNGNIYASYHMRGGNWGNDTYDKDDIEGCIERWSFNGEDIQLGNWMWTNDFDFNHILLDGNYIITVGHKGGEGENGNHTDFGGIIGRLPVSFADRNWNADEELLREDFNYKYLTTDEAILNEKGWVEDYKNAGDGNCVIKVNDKYFVATSAGYGVINASDFKRVKGDDGKVLFTQTPGSAKYIVEENGEVKVLYLNERASGNTTATTSFGATLATLSTSTFPFSATTKAMQNNVSPVDGKNVITVDNGIVYACLAKGGLQIGDKVISFGESRSVNGVTVDDKYVYVANGNYISVLDKTTHNVVVERKGETKNVSANFVEVKEYNGVKYVFVAFGQEGIKVYQFKNC